MNILNNLRPKVDTSCSLPNYMRGPNDPKMEAKFRIQLETEMKIFEIAHTLFAEKKYSQAAQFAKKELRTLLVGPRTRIIAAHLSMIGFLSLKRENKTKQSEVFVEKILKQFIKDKELFNNRKASLFQEIDSFDLTKIAPEFHVSHLIARMHAEITKIFSEHLNTLIGLINTNLKEKDFDEVQFNAEKMMRFLQSKGEKKRARIEMLKIFKKIPEMKLSWEFANKYISLLVSCEDYQNALKVIIQSRFIIFKKFEPVQEIIKNAEIINSEYNDKNEQASLYFLNSFLSYYKGSYEESILDATFALQTAKDPELQAKIYAHLSETYVYEKKKRLAYENALRGLQNDIEDPLIRSFLFQMIVKLQSEITKKVFVDVISEIFPTNEKLLAFNNKLDLMYKEFPSAIVPGFLSF